MYSTFEVELKITNTMIRLITTLIITSLVFISTAFSQDLTGSWYGQLDIQGTKLKINFHVSEKEGIYTTTMDSPDQGAIGIPTTKTIVNNNILEIILKEMKINFIGELKGDKIDGAFKQAGMEFPLILSKIKIVSEKPKTRPQDPKKSYNYKSEDVYFTNSKANNIKLVGTLTLPKNVKKPAVAILISGSGPQNRNSEIFNHRPFLVIADYLTNNGIAVLRFDDRGVAKSEGTQKGATSKDFATDVEAAVKYLKTRNDIDTKKIGLIGHSEGGLIASMVVSKNKDVVFVVLLASPGVDGGEVLRTQTKKALELAGSSQEHIDFNDKLSNEIYSLVKSISNVDNLKLEITNHLKKASEIAPLSIATQLTDINIKNQVKTVTSPWMMYFIKTNPKQFLEKVTCPVLAINGAKDFQVIADLNLNGIKSALSKNKDVTIKKLEGLNHLFQTCETGAFNEYAQIEETFSPKALEIIKNWINKRF